MKNADDVTPKKAGPRKSREAASPAGQTLVVVIPGGATLRLRHVVLDFNGTLASGGALSRGVRARLRALADRLPLSVLTADTFGTARSALRGLPLQVAIVRNGIEKRRFVAAKKGVVAIGNGRNDVAMMRAADLGIAILGPEGAASELLNVSDVVVGGIAEALDLLLHVERLVATLRP